MKSLSFTALQKLRGDEPNTMLARRALGAVAAQASVVSLANYFSRVMNGRVPTVGFVVLTQLAEGLGYKSLGAFFTDWERVTADKPPRRRVRRRPPVTVQPFPIFLQPPSPPTAKSVIKGKHLRHEGEVILDETATAQINQAFATLARVLGPKNYAAAIDAAPARHSVGPSSAPRHQRQTHRRARRG